MWSVCTFLPGFITMLGVFPAGRKLLLYSSALNKKTQVHNFALDCWPLPCLTSVKTAAQF